MDYFALPEESPVPQHWNIAPTQMVSIIKSTDGARHLTMARWGLIPHWAKDPVIGSRLMNARSEYGGTPRALIHVIR